MSLYYINIEELRDLLRGEQIEVNGIPAQLDNAAECQIFNIVEDMRYDDDDDF